MSEGRFRFAGWFTLDVRVAAACALVAVAVATLYVVLRLRGRRWEDHVVAFFAVFGLVLAATWAATHAIGSNPAFRIETFFPVP